MIVDARSHRMLVSVDETGAADGCISAAHAPHSVTPFALGCTLRIAQSCEACFGSVGTC